MSSESTVSVGCSTRTASPPDLAPNTADAVSRRAPVVISFRTIRDFASPRSTALSKVPTRYFALPGCQIASLHPSGQKGRTRSHNEHAHKRGANEHRCSSARPGHNAARLSPPHPPAWPAVPPRSCGPYTPSEAPVRDALPQSLAEGLDGGKAALQLERCHRRAQTAMAARSACVLGPRGFPRDVTRDLPRRKERGSPMRRGGLEAPAGGRPRGAGTKTGTVGP